MPRNSPTADQLNARRFQDRTDAVPAWVVSHPTFVPRLTWRVSKTDTDLEALSRALRLNAHAIFPDTSIFDDELDQEQLWRPVLEGSGAIMLTSHVIRESTPHLGERRDRHPIVRALVDRHPRVIFGADGFIGGDVLVACDYYLSLLRARRRVLEPLIAHHVSETGKAPEPTDMIRMRMEVQRELGNRAVKLERKAGDTSVFTDEHLVVVAIEHALRTGEPTIILTRDWDVEEQFFKLLWLLDTHYRAMLLARKYRNEFARFSPRRITQKQAKGLLVGDNNVWFERDPDLGFVLPSIFRFVPISLVRITDQTTQLTLGAETGMYEVLRTKARTGGRNTDLLGDRNMHISAGPLHLNSGHDVAIVGHDQCYASPGGKVHVAGLDVLQAIYSQERHSSLVKVNTKIVPAQTGPFPRTAQPEPIKYGPLWLPYGTKEPQ